MEFSKTKWIAPDTSASTTNFKESICTKILLIDEKWDHKVKDEATIHPLFSLRKGINPETPSSNPAPVLKKVYTNKPYRFLLFLQTSDKQTKHWVINFTITTSLTKHEVHHSLQQVHSIRINKFLL